jgi:hypothetical protein
MNHPYPEASPSAQASEHVLSAWLRLLRVRGGRSPPLLSR